MEKPLVSIVIPCLNERQTIAQCVRQAYHYGKKSLPGNFEIIVADNGSTDGSLKILSEHHYARIVHVPVRGYGAALHWGILKSLGKYILFADADLSYPFSNLPLFLRKLPTDPDMILGSRLKGKIQPGAMPFLNRYLGTPILTLLIRLLYHIPTTDCNSGMRLIKRSFYQKLNMRNSGMEWASELLLKTAIHKGKYREVNINFAKDRRNRPPHLSRWADGWRHLKTIILLKPKTLPFIMLLSLIASVITFKISFALTSFFILLSAVLYFSWLALWFLAYAIEGKHNDISLILNSNLLVPWIMAVSVICGGIILLLPDKHLGTKMILVGILSIIYMWTFLIETIKTHLVNRLPNINK